MVQQAAMVKTPTSATSLEGRLRLTNRPDKPYRRGFTLIELLVVLAIGALLVALAPTAYSKYRESTQYGAVLRTLASDMRQARQRATSSGIPVVFSVDLDKRKYGVEGISDHAVPEPLQIRATVGSEQLQKEGLASIIFLPGGGATGGSIDVIRPSGDGARLRVDWLFGHVSKERLTQ